MWKGVFPCTLIPFRANKAQIQLGMEHVSVEEEGLGIITKEHPFSLQQQT